MGGDRVLGLEMGFRDLWRDTGEGVTPAMGKSTPWTCVASRHNVKSSG